MHRLDRRAIIWAILLTIAVVVVSLLAFPEWRGSWGLVVVLSAGAAVVVVGFIAAVRQAFEKPASPADPPAVSPTAQNVRAYGNVNAEHIVAGYLTMTQSVDGDNIRGDKNITQVIVQAAKQA